MMTNLLRWVKQEFIRILPVTIFFFVAFSLGDITDRVVNKDALSYYSFFSCVIAALIMAKVVLIADHMPFIDLFKGKPLIYNTVWKTVVYVACAILLRLLERLIPAIWAGTSWDVIFQEIIARIELPLFWVGHAWLTALFFNFVAYRELIQAIGNNKVWNLFFGK